MFRSPIVIYLYKNYDEFLIFFLHLNAQCTKAAEVACCVSQNYNPVYLPQGRSTNEYSSLYSFHFYQKYVKSYAFSDEGSNICQNSKSYYLYKAQKRVKTISAKFLTSQEAVNWYGFFHPNQSYK